MGDEFANQIICGDAADVMRQLPAESVHLIVTSPPCWNLVHCRVEGQIEQTSYAEYLKRVLAFLRASVERYFQAQNG
jgi:DNA modification methylase